MYTYIMHSKLFNPQNNCLKRDSGFFLYENTFGDYLIGRMPLKGEWIWKSVCVKRRFINAEWITEHSLNCSKSVRAQKFACDIFPHSLWNSLTTHNTFTWTFEAFFFRIWTVFSFSLRRRYKKVLFEIDKSHLLAQLFCKTEENQSIKINIKITN